MGVEKALPPGFEPAVGLLSDRNIKEALKLGLLFDPETARVQNAKYSTYEIRVGDVYEQLRFEKDAVAHSPKHVGESDKIEIQPGQTVLVIAEERFRIPTDVFAKVTTVGQIFSSGLAAENTFADPGYDGPLYITLSNISTRTLTLKRFDPLARVEFHRLSAPVEKPHPGFSGRRPSFVGTAYDTQLRQLLLGKSVPELLEEMVNKSIDEALAQRFSRSEVLIEKAHREILELRAVQGAVHRLRTLTAFLVGIVVFVTLNAYGVLRSLPIERATALLLDIAGGVVASIIFFYIERRLNEPKH